jgi:nucleotide-binding universal stress UspA family protein
MASHDQALSYLAGLREKFPDVRGLDLIRTSDAAESILQVAAEFDIDLIAMGAPVRNSLTKQFLGHVAASVVQRSPLPVLFRRPGAFPSHQTLRRILVPVDGSEDALTILPAVRTLALRTRAEVVFLHVSERARAALSAHRGPGEGGAAEDPKAKLLSLADRLEKSGLVFWQTIGEGDPVEEIHNHAEALDADVIAMATLAVREPEGTVVGRAALDILGRTDRAVLLQKPSPLPLAPPAWTFQ